MVEKISEAELEVLKVLWNENERCHPLISLIP
jgi:predicted transcriptional regulator